MSSEEFTKVELGAHKLTTGCKISNELLADAAYDIADHLLKEFTKSMAGAEENAFICGSGNGEPTGFMRSLETLRR